MVKFLNRVKVATSTSGTGNVTLGSADPSFQTFADAGAVTGDEIPYLIEEGNTWEIGLGTYNSTGPVLARTTVYANSLGTTAKLSLVGSGTRVSVVLSANYFQDQLDQLIAFNWFYQ